MHNRPDYFSMDEDAQRDVLSAEEIVDALGMGIPLLVAVRDGNVVQLEQLLQAGADVDASIHTMLPFDRPIEIAMLYMENQIATVKLLIKYGANVHQLDNFGRSLLFFCIDYRYPCFSPELFKFILSTGIDINIINKGGDTLLMYYLNHLQYQDLSRDPDFSKLDMMLADPRLDLSIKDNTGKTVTNIANQKDFFTKFPDVTRRITTLFFKPIDQEIQNRASRLNAEQTPRDVTGMIKSFVVGSDYHLMNFKPRSP